MDLNVGSQDGYRLSIRIDESHPLYSFVKSSWLWRFKFPYSKIKGLNKEELVVTFINLDCSQRFFYTSHIQNIAVLRVFTPQKLRGLGIKGSLQGKPEPFLSTLQKIIFLSGCKYFFMLDVIFCLLKNYHPMQKIMSVVIDVYKFV